eukprot:CAMPEP_0172165400 /NCGR_PEP_ID=MMETSP1050-20130122/8388_1 /TAXON_ID=233186 /ORGANISM="Cryptomonas curvata, Strain CCAP979/52" /LENGTH=49 /DNA_ID=CAMNT_0012835861 /DNA_START=94 /DNA_END=243 /DNA_ORIENTATION=-
MMFEILLELNGKGIAHPLPNKVKLVKKAAKTVQPKASTDDCAKEMFCKV